jgi:GntR family transcriptional regulator
MNQRQISPSAMTGTPSLPKHSLVANSIAEEIASGRFKIGDLLPTESKLSVQFDCSRHTIRVALRTLYERGLVIGYQGKGTLVQGIPSHPRYLSSYQTLERLLQYAAESSRELLDISNKKITGELATWLGCSSGSSWWEIKTIRKRKHDHKVFAASSIYVPQIFQEAVLALTDSTLPLFSILEGLPNYQIVTIEQLFSVAKATKEESLSLDLNPGDPVMSVERRFYCKKRRLIEVARSVHPPELYQYHMTLRQEIGPIH